MHSTALLAQAPAASGGGQQMMTMLLMFGTMIVIFYFIIWRPQRKREQERKRVLESLKKNDHVLTSGGIYGVVHSVKDNEVMLKIDDAGNVKIRIARSCIVGVVNENSSSGEEEVAKQAEQTKV